MQIRADINHYIDYGRGAQYTPTYFYKGQVSAEQTELLNPNPPSNVLEECFANKVDEWHERNKEAWETGVGVEGGEDIIENIEEDMEDADPNDMLL